jgi:hypothetical protein
VVPLFDDVNCPYGVKPSDLFKLNEVGLSDRRMWRHIAVPGLYSSTAAQRLLSLGPCRTRTCPSSRSLGALLVYAQR